VLETLTNGYLTRATELLDLIFGQRFSLPGGVIKPRRDSEPMALLKALSSLNRLTGFPFAMPDRGVEPDTAGDDVNVVMRGIRVPDHDVLVIGHAHLRHEVRRNVEPALFIKNIGTRQRKAAMPNRALDFGALLSGHRELGSEHP